MNLRIASLVATLAAFSWQTGITAETVSLTAPTPGDYTARISDDHDRNTAFFTWTPAGMQPLKRLIKTWPEDHYRICLFDGDTCESSQTGQVFEVIPGARDIPPFRYRPADHDLKIDLAFQETAFNWAIAACVRNTQQCSPYSKSMPIHWTQKRLPVLLAPQHAAVRDPMDKTMFHWDATEDAEFYILCLAKPNLTCPAKLLPPSEDLFTLVVPNTQRQAYLQTLLNSALSEKPLAPYQQARLHGQEMYWTVGICRDGRCQYQPNVNTITFDRGRAEIHVRNNSRFDINGLWLVDLASGQRSLLIHDMTNYRPPGALSFRSGLYNDDYLTRVDRQHMGNAEPKVAPYYAFAYQSELPGSVRRYGATASTSISFAPGIQYLPEFTVERETMFILDNGTRFEQILRGPDGERYVYRPGGSFRDHPAAGEGPVLLSVLREEGYNAY